MHSREICGALTYQHTTHNNVIRLKIFYIPKHKHYVSLSQEINEFEGFNNNRFLQLHARLKDAHGRVHVHYTQKRSYFSSLKMLQFIGSLWDIHYLQQSKMLS